MAQQMKVFVSHSHQNNAFCKKLVKALKGADADVWYDDESLHTGRLGPIIERELRQRPVFIVVLSPAALASRWVEDETRWAYNLLRHHDPTRIMLPVLAEVLPSEDDIWLFLQEFKRIGATGSKPFPPAQAIAATLRALVLTPAGAAPTPTTPQPAESVDELITHGRALLAQGKYAEAVLYFQRATQRDPHDFLAWFNLGYANDRLKHWPDALTAQDRALTLDQNHARTWYNKATSLVNLGRHEEALAACDRALDLDPTIAWAWINKGAALANLDRHGEALAAYDRALDLDPSNSLAWNNKADALYNIGRYDDAISAVDQALALDPSVWEHWETKGQVLNAQLRFDDALPYLMRALALEPNDAELWHDKAVALRELGREREAEEAERRAKELDWKG